MVFTLEHYEHYEDMRLENLRIYELIQYEKLKNRDSATATQMFLLLNKLGNLALQHKQIILNFYIQLINTQVEIIKSNNSIIAAAAGNISPVADITNFLPILLKAISNAAVMTTIGNLIQDFREYSTKPLIGYISEILQATESIRDQDLKTLYNALSETYFIRPDLALR